MAAVTSAGVGAGDTSNGNPYVSASFTPTAGDLLVFIAYLAGTTDAAFTASASANSITFTRAVQFLGDAGGKRMVCFVADQLVPSSPSSMTVQVDNAPSDPATGCVYEVLRVTGMTATGSSAVLQSAGADSNLTAGNTPAVTFASAPDAANPVIGFTGNNTNPSGVTEPSGFTERFDGGFATPDTGLEVASVDSSGPTTVTWGSTSTRGVAVAIELDSSAAGLGGTLGVTTETDAAQPLGKRKTKISNISVETDAAQALGRQKSRSLNISTEADAAQPVGSRKVKALGTATETDTALPLARTKRLALGAAVETDLARPITRLVSGVATSPAVETDAAQPLGRVKRKAIDPAYEVDAAVALSGGLLMLAYTPPTYEQQMRVDGSHILRYFRLTTAPTLVKIGGVWTSIVTPDPSLLEGKANGVDYLRGGYIYELSQNTVNELVAAGFPSA